jgi:phosphohistidine swiveling domain-containing protein
MREELIEKWVKERPKAEEGMWDQAPGYELIPEVDLSIFNSFFLDGTHSCPPLSPLGLELVWARGCTHGLKYVNSYFSMPRCYGWEGRTKDAGIYWAFLLETDEGKIKEREKAFMDALLPFIQDFDGIWEKHKAFITKEQERMKTFLPDRPKNYDYLHYHWELERFIIQTHWELHFLGMQSSYSAWLLLEEECKRRFGIDDKAPDFQDMLRGFDNEIYRVDGEIWSLAKEAVDMGLGLVFKERPLKEIYATLNETTAGREWKKKFDKFLEERGWRTIGFDLCDLSWLEDPTIPLGKIVTSVVTGEAEKEQFPLQKVRSELERRREEAVRRMLDRVPEADREWFRSLIGLAQKASSYSEEHDLFFEMTFFAIAGWGYRKIGEWLAKNGCIDRPEDIFMLNGREIENALMVPFKSDMRWIARRRRERWEYLRERFAKEGEFRQPVYTVRGDIQQAVLEDLLPSMDPICIKIVVGELPQIKPEEIGADIMGICGCPGEAEGYARVITEYTQLKDLRPGEILVCPQTGPEWTVAFGIASAVVTDRGGTLSHAAIIGREFNVPTVVNTFVGTSKIRTGQKVRVDAGTGAIYIRG